MNKLYRKASRVVFCLAVFMLGCENIALVGRPTLESRGQPSSVTATVNGVDHGLRELYLRTAADQHWVVNYSRDTRVLSDGREYEPTALRVGDRVQVALREGPDKKLYAEEIRVQGTATGAATHVRTVEGTVERVLRDRGVMDVRLSDGNVLTVYVPPSASAETQARFGEVRRGDYVRLDGERLGGDRLELLAFR